MTNRLNKYCESDHLFTDLQFGFREKKGTVDCIYILHCIIQKCLAKNKKLYCAFIDYEKCFDTINRDMLIHKLILTGLSSKFVRIIKALYTKVTSCVKVTSSSKMSDFFDVSIGLKQGEPLSPFDIDNLTDGDLDILSIYLLMFADDMVVFTTDKSSLQSQLNSLYDYTDKWGLKINVSKSKICIFEKRKTDCNFVWDIAGETLEIVYEFCYLGIKFYRTGRMQNAVNALNDQALKQ